MATATAKTKSQEKKDNPPAKPSPGRGPLWDAVAEFGITADSCGMPVADLIKAASKTDDPRGYLSAFATIPPDEAGAGDDPAEETPSAPPAKAESYQQRVYRERKAAAFGPDDGTAEPITIQDVIQSDQEYSPRRIEHLLGITEQTMFRAISGRALRTANGHGGSGARITGFQLLRWIERENVRFEITEAIADICRRERERTEPTPEPEPGPKGGVDKMLDELRDRDVSRAAAREYDVAQSWDRYRALLLELAETDACDTGRLVDLTGELGIDTDRVKEDLRIISKARDLMEAHAGCEAAHARAVEASAAHKALEKQHAEEEEASRKARHQAAAEAENGHNAGYKLFELSKRRPELFNGADPPMLLDPRPAADATK